ncbi:tRNA dihydrouridine(20/20a) synthase DusA [Ferruginivarius sediminum]|uniref:tRNA-dihydrouridine(20/20a) synthase n=1 Tax=Ferruginivarius sediminum TaxID=2661937 RepID=A0A369TE50_9PROT|nr:tRNA dihydrouridine(20/20a) synthase DusA [Ferruginivarius sediminum]RDD63548.1 tRNA dihydrouridine(20/20a) synthase DusA [Ferruginivarius sediminum]
MSHTGTYPDRRLSVAPMMDCTDRHDRFFLRQITRRTLLYTEMVTTGAVLNGDREKLLGFDPVEHPVALQLGGAEPRPLADCAAIAQDWGYDEVNLNVGCPSDRVQNARFGACLMAEPRLVADCVAAMRDAVSIPVTVKTRIGIDDRDSEAALRDFVDTVAATGCRTFIVHARKAWLQGLSPKENRNVPPLDYGRVYRLKQARPDLEIIINGGVPDLDTAKTHLDAGMDGVMLGRAAYHTPWILAEADRRFFGAASALPTRADVIAALMGYAQRLQSEGLPVKVLTRHIMGLCAGLPGARAWRRHLSEVGRDKDAGPEVIAEAFAHVERPLGAEEVDEREIAAQ